jgi:hypothetical protein
MDTTIRPLKGPLPHVHPLLRLYITEAKLGHEGLVLDGLAHLWSLHQQIQNSENSNPDELRIVGRTLGEALFAVKLLLAKQGCSDQWSEFLEEQEITKTVADRLVAFFEESVTLEISRFMRTTQAPTEAAIHKLFRTVWNRLQSKLTTQGSIYLFLRLLISTSGLTCEYHKHGILIVDPATTGTEELEVVTSPRVFTTAFKSIAAKLPSTGPRS